METDYQVEALRMLRDPRTMHRRWLLRELSKVCYPLITQFNFVRQLPPDDAWFTFNGHVYIAMTQVDKNAIRTFCNWAYQHWPISGAFQIKLFPGMKRVTKTSLNEAPSLPLSLRKAIEVVFPSRRSFSTGDITDEEILINPRYMVGTSMSQFDGIVDGKGYTGMVPWNVRLNNFDLRVCNTQGEPFK